MLADNGNTLLVTMKSSVTELPLIKMPAAMIGGWYIEIYKKFRFVALYSSSTRNII